MTLEPEVSVIIPCYNYGAFLPGALASVASQTFTSWECIVVDDGSTDDTSKVAQEWLQKDSRFVYLRQENAGLAAARNAGLLCASGEFVQFLDADDTVDSSKLGRQVDILRSSPRNTQVHSTFQYFHEATGEIELGPDYGQLSLSSRKSLLWRLIFDWENGFVIPIHAFLFRRSVIDAVGGFAEDIPTHEDIDLYLRLAMNNVVFVYQAENLAEYRVHFSNMSKNLSRMQQGYLGALGNALKAADSFPTKILVFARYGIEVSQCLIHWFRRRDISLTQSLFKSGHPVASTGSLLLLPIFLVVSLIRKLRFA